LTKKNYYESITYTEFVNLHNDYHTMMEIFDDCFHLSAMALKDLTGLKYNPYYIKEILKFTRLWNIKENIDTLLSLKNSVILDWKKENYDKYKKICEEEMLEYDSSIICDIVSANIEKPNPVKESLQEQARNMRQLTFDF